MKTQQASKIPDSLGNSPTETQQRHGATNDNPSHTKPSQYEEQSRQLASKQLSTIRHPSHQPLNRHMSGMVCKDMNGCPKCRVKTGLWRLLGGLLGDVEEGDEERLAEERKAWKGRQVREEGQKISNVNNIDTKRGQSQGPLTTTNKKVDSPKKQSPLIAKQVKKQATNSSSVKINTYNTHVIQAGDGKKSVATKQYQVVQKQAIINSKKLIESPNKSDINKKAVITKQEYLKKESFIKQIVKKDEPEKGSNNKPKEGTIIGDAERKDSKLAEKKQDKLFDKLVEKKEENKLDKKDEKVIQHKLVEKQVQKKQEKKEEKVDEKALTKTQKHPNPSPLKLSQQSIKHQSPKKHNKQQQMINKDINNHNNNHNQKPIQSPSKLNKSPQKSNNNLSKNQPIKVVTPVKKQLQQKRNISNNSNSNLNNNNSNLNNNNNKQKSPNKSNINGNNNNSGHPKKQQQPIKIQQPVKLQQQIKPIQNNNPIQNAKPTQNPKSKSPQPTLLINKQLYQPKQQQLQQQYNNQNDQQQDDNDDQDKQDNGNIGQDGQKGNNKNNNKKKNKKRLSNQQNKLGYGDVRSSGYGQVNGSGYGQVNGSGYGQVNGSGYGDIKSSGYGQVSSSGYGQPRSLSKNNSKIIQLAPKYKLNNNQKLDLINPYVRQATLPTKTVNKRGNKDAQQQSSGEDKGLEGRAEGRRGSKVEVKKKSLLAPKYHMKTTNDQERDGQSSGQNNDGSSSKINDNSASKQTNNNPSRSLPPVRSSLKAPNHPLSTNPYPKMQLIINPKLSVPSHIVPPRKSKTNMSNPNDRDQDGQEMGDSGREGVRKSSFERKRSTLLARGSLSKQQPQIQGSRKSPLLSPNTLPILPNQRSSTIKASPPHGVNASPNMYIGADDIKEVIRKQGGTYHNKDELRRSSKIIDGSDRVVGNNDRSSNGSEMRLKAQNGAHNKGSSPMSGGSGRQIHAENNSSEVKLPKI